MSFLRDLGKDLLGRGRDTGRWQRQIDKRTLRKTRRQDRRLMQGLRGTLEEWYSNDFLRELISPAYQSRVVARQQEAIGTGLAATKRQVRDASALQGTGKAFANRQEFLADVGAQGQMAGVQGQQEIQRQQVGAQREAEYATTSADIKQLGQSLGRSRTAFSQGSKSAYNEWQGQRRAQQSGKIVQYAATAAGAAIGGPGGAIAGSQLGAAIAPGGGTNQFAGAMESAFGADPAKTPETVGFNPLLSFAMGQMGKMGVPQAPAGAVGMLPSQGVTPYNQYALQLQSRSMGGGR